MTISVQIDNLRKISRVKNQQRLTGLLLLFVAAVMNLLPGELPFVSKLIPLSYGGDAFRSTLMGYPAGFPELAPIEVELWIITLFGFFMPLIGFWLYQRAEAKARRTSLSEY